MSLLEITRQRQRINELFKKAGGLADDPELQAHWSQYLCILVAAFLETSVRVIYSEYSRQRAEPNVASFVSRKMRRFQNPNMERILQVAASFNREWASQIRDTASGRLAESVDSIVANRHQIAHGASVGVTISRLRPWYNDVVRLVDLMKSQCGLP
jgi:hypothetical protein